MKTKLVLFVCLIIISFISCTEKQMDINNPTNNTSSGVQHLNLPAYQKFGIMNLSFPINDSTYIEWGHPNGWDGITVSADIVHLPSLKAAKNSGYYPIVGVLYREDIVNNNMTSIAQTITACSPYVDWFYIDDALSSGGISTTEINTVAGYVHTASRILAVAEYDFDAMATNTTWFQNVDIIMPYRYGNDLLDPKLSDLRSHFEFVRTTFPGKGLVPILGYKAEIWNNTNSFHTPDQLGSASGNTAYIELAREFTTRNIVFYYHKWDTGINFNTNTFYDNGAVLTYFYNLTDYLKYYYRLGNIDWPIVPD